MIALRQWRSFWGFCWAHVVYGKLHLSRSDNVINFDIVHNLIISLNSSDCDANYRWMGCSWWQSIPECQSFNQYPKPQQSQPNATAANRPDPQPQPQTQTQPHPQPQPQQGHLRMPQHVELVRHFLKLIFSQRTVNTDTDTDTDTGCCQKEIIQMIGNYHVLASIFGCPLSIFHWLLAVAYCQLTVLQLPCANNKLHLSSAA